VKGYDTNIRLHGARSALRNCPFPKWVIESWWEHPLVSMDGDNSHTFKIVNGAVGDLTRQGEVVPKVANMLANGLETAIGQLAPDLKQRDRRLGGR
jgi:hypothetical protein